MKISINRICMSITLGLAALCSPIAAAAQTTIIGSLAGQVLDPSCRIHRQSDHAANSGCPYIDARAAHPSFWNRFAKTQYQCEDHGLWIYGNSNRKERKL
jgi:hypothetical protein